MLREVCSWSIAPVVIWISLQVRSHVRSPGQASAFKIFRIFQTLTLYAYACIVMRMCSPYLPRRCRDRRGFTL